MCDVSTPFFYYVDIVLALKCARVRAFIMMEAQLASKLIRTGIGIVFPLARLEGIVYSSSVWMQALLLL